jgi:tetratricopeptide (TPR) repeat protein
MAGNNRNWLNSIKKLPGWIAGLITFVTAVVGFVKLWQGDTGLVTIVLLAVGAGGGTLGCIYLAFKRTPPLVEGGKGTWQHPRWRPWALAGLVIIPLLTAGGVGYHLYQQAQPPDKVILLVADFDGPEPQKYRVTETVLARLRAALEPYDDVQVQALGRAITEAEGSAAARAEGEKRQAAIVLWGWYGATAEAVPLSVHFEVLRPSKYMPALGLEAKGQVQTMAVAELESFTLQTRLSAEMAYLSLFTVGMARYAAEDWDAAIARFSDALSQTAERVPALDQSTVCFYRGNTYHYKSDLDRAIADFDQAIQLQPDFSCAYNNRGNAYADKGDTDHAITDYDRVIQLQPDLAEAYNNRGTAYGQKGDYDRAIADFDQAIQLQPDLAEAYNNRGLTYGRKGETDRAIADFDQAIQLQPNYADAYFNRGLVYADKGDYDRAIANFDQAIQLQPDDAMAYYNRGLDYRQKGEKEKAIADFRKFLELSNDPDLRQQAEEQLKALGAK